MKNTKEVIIIPDEKKLNKSVYQEKIKIDESINLVIEKFLKQNNLTLSKEHSNNLTIELAKLGHLIIEKGENIILYLPQVITSNQYKFLQENKNNIKQYSGSVFINSLQVRDENNSLYSVIREYEKDKLESLYDELREKYIPNNNSYVLIVPNEQEVKVENGVYYQEFDSNLLEGHGNIYQLFCRKNQIMVNIPNSGGYFWGKELANMNIMSILKEDDEIYIFMPRKLSKNQSEWFIGKEDYLLSFKFLEAGIYDKDGTYKELYRNEFNKNQSNLELVNRIYQYVNDKQTINEIKK